MANTIIKIKSSGTTGNVPSTLNVGELALNYTDAKLFYRNNVGSVVAFSSGGNSFATVNANSTLVLASSSTDILSIVGTGSVTVTGNSTTKTVTINGTTGNTTIYFSSFVGNGTNTNYTLTNPSVASQIVAINGVYQMISAGAYTMSGNVVTFSEAPTSGATIEVTSFSNSNTTVIPLTSFNGRTGAITLTQSDVSNLYTLFANSSTTSVIGIDVSGGTANQILYQTGANATSYITAPITNGTVLTYTTSGGFIWTTPTWTSNTTTYLSSFTGNGTNTSFTLTNPSVNTQIVFINGVYQMFSSNAYSMSGNVLTFTAAPFANSAIEVISYTSSNVTIVPMTSFNGRTGAITLVQSDVSNFYTLFSNSSTTSVIAMNINGGAANQILYQTGTNTTSFIAAPTTNNTILTWLTSGGLSWQAPPVSSFNTRTGVITLTTADVSTALSTGNVANASITGSLAVGGVSSFSNTATFGIGTSSFAPINIPQGVLLTSPIQGALEANAQSLYYTANNIGSRAVVQTAYYFRNNSANTLISQTGVQSWLGLQKGVYLVGNTTYEIIGEFQLNTTGTTSHTEGLAWTLTTGTVNSVAISIIRTANSTTATSPTAAWANTTGITICSGAITTSQSVVYSIQGTVTTGLAGFMRPDIAFSVAPTGVSSVSQGAYIRFMPIAIGANNVAVGNWV